MRSIKRDRVLDEAVRLFAVHEAFRPDVSIDGVIEAFRASQAATP